MNQQDSSITGSLNLKLWAIMLEGLDRADGHNFLSGVAICGCHILGRGAVIVDFSRVLGHVVMYVGVERYKKLCSKEESWRSNLSVIDTYDPTKTMLLIHYSKPEDGSNLFFSNTFFADLVKPEPIYFVSISSEILAFL